MANDPLPPEIQAIFDRAAQRREEEERAKALPGDPVARKIELINRMQQASASLSSIPGIPMDAPKKARPRALGTVTSATSKSPARKESTFKAWLKARLQKATEGLEDTLWTWIWGLVLSALGALGLWLWKG
jgi:hypothetical protein